MTAPPKVAETVDLAGDVREAQERIARAIRVGEMRGDPLCDVLEAISTSLGVQLQLHEAAVKRAQLPVDPAALVRLEEAAATGADRRAAKLAWAHTLRATLFGVAVVVGAIMMTGAGGFWWGHRTQAAAITSTEAGVMAAFRDGPDAAAAWLNLMRANDAKQVREACAGSTVTTAGGRRACAIGLWLDLPANPAPRTERAGR